MKADDHYVVITADSHAGGSHAQYREYLDPQYRDDFDAWRGKYKNPFKDLKDTDLRVRNWDGELRDQQQNEDGIVGEVIFPNTVPPFFPNFVLVRGAAEPGRVRASPRGHPGPQPLAGRLLRGQARSPRRDRPDLPQRPRRRHRRRAVVPGARPARRRARRVTSDHLRLAEAPVRPALRPALGGVRRARRSGERALAAPAVPRTSAAPAMPIVHIAEMVFYSQRPFVYLITGGVFERFPDLKFILTEAGCAWIPGVLEQLDDLMVDAAPRRHGGDALRGRDRPTAERDGVLPPELPRRDEPAATGRHPGGARPGRHRPGHVGQRLPARGRHAALHARAPAAGDARPGARADPADRRRQRGRGLRLRSRGAATGGRQVRSDRRGDRPTARRASRTSQRGVAAIGSGAGEGASEARRTVRPGRRPLQVLPEAALGLHRTGRAARSDCTEPAARARSRSPSATAWACSRATALTSATGPLVDTRMVKPSPWASSDVSSSSAAERTISTSGGSTTSGSVPCSSLRYTLCGSRPSMRASRKAAVRTANGPSAPLKRLVGATIGSAAPRVFSSGMSSKVVRMMVSEP